jgi:hypothetical protein
MILTKEGPVFQELLKTIEGLKRDINTLKHDSLSSKYIIGCDPYKPDPKPEFKVGQWVIGKNGMTPYNPARIYEVSDGTVKYFYCSKLTGEECKSYADTDYIRLATPFEIEAHLRKICDEKGLLKDGQRLKSALGYPFEFKLKNGVDYILSHDSLYNKGMALYSEGEWAEIVPDKKKLPKTKEELTVVISRFNTSDKSLTEFLKDYED